MITGRGGGGGGRIMQIIFVLRLQVTVVALQKRDLQNRNVLPSPSTNSGWGNLAKPAFEC